MPRKSLLIIAVLALIAEPLTWCAYFHHTGVFEEAPTDQAQARTPMIAYNAAATPAERQQVMRQAMLAPHPHNVYLLRQGVTDTNAEVRREAMRLATASFPAEVAFEVYRLAAFSHDAQVRAMLWKTVASKDVAYRTRIYGEALYGKASKAEAFAEMASAPTKAYVDMVIGRWGGFNSGTPTAEPEYPEIARWINAGGGKMPPFVSGVKAQEWWKTNREEYNENLQRLQ